MTDKAYIVANEQQEREVLEKLEQKGFVWSAGVLPTKFFPNTTIFGGEKFPYALIETGGISWADLSKLTDEEIVFDGRKEEQMSDKYVVSQEFMNELEEWKARLNVNGRYYVFEEDVYDFPSLIETWWKYRMSKSDKETNNRLIAIIRWVNGEDVFEVEKPKKWVVRSKESDEDDDYGYVLAGTHGIAVTSYNISRATKFDTKEEAESWANAHQEVIEVEI